MDRRLTFLSIRDETFNFCFVKAAVMTEPNRISAKNLGPISELEFCLEKPGVTVLVAPNGSGKSILLEAVQAAARGEGKLPLKDRTRRGSVEAFGAVITIGGTCRHTGSFEITHLEGRFDLASVVDPRIKSPAAADKARIKALVNLTGVEASAELFRNHEAFLDFDTVVTENALATDDLVEMAAKIKVCYDEAALTSERLAERKFGQATALIAPSDLDLTLESDAGTLQSQYNEARDQLTRLEEQRKLSEAARQKTADAAKILQQLGSDELASEKENILVYLEKSKQLIQDKQAENIDLQQRINANLAEIKRTQTDLVTYSERLTAIDRQTELVDNAKKVLAESAIIDPPDEDDLQDAREAVDDAQRAVEMGVKIRTAKENAKKVSELRAEAKAAQDKSSRYRDAGKSTDEVLSGCIRCSQLRVESDGKTARLVTDITERGKSIPYHDVSDGEKYSIAIDIAADHVGEGGLLVISQIGWEGIDGANRIAIHRHAIERGIYILTAEAASDPTAKREIKPLSLDEAEAEQVRGNAVAAEQAKLASDDPPKPKAKKPKPEPQQKETPSPPPEPSGDDLDDVPW